MHDPMHAADEHAEAWAAHIESAVPEMTSNALSAVNGAHILEQVIISGDLAQLKPQERVEYYAKVCESVGLNPLTKPFDYIKLNNKLTLYAKRDAADQLRKIHGISIEKPDVDMQGDLIVVSVTARDKTGRTDADLGVVALGTLKGEAKANAMLKAITKAKRRVTLSLAGLGWLDETEVETIPGAQHVAAETPTLPPSADTRPLAHTEGGDVVDANTGEIVEEAPQVPAEEPQKADPLADKRAKVKHLEAEIEWGDEKHKINARKKHLGEHPDEAAIEAYIDYLTGKIEEQDEALGKAA